MMVAAMLHNSTNPQAVFNDLDAIATANTRGRRLLSQVSCCPLPMDFTLASPYLVEGLRSWQPALALSSKALKKLLAEPSLRDAVRAARADERRGHRPRRRPRPARRGGPDGHLPQETLAGRLLTEFSA
jgi:hypothetical protein